MERPPDARVPLGRELALGACILLAGIACAALGSALLRSDPSGPDAMLLATLAAQAFFACTAVGGKLLAGPSVFPVGLRLGRPRLRAPDLALLVLGFVLVSHALSLVLASLALRETGTLAEIDRVVASSQGPSQWLALAALGLAPALGEELLFRGLVQRAAALRLRPAAAILVSSAAFGLIHADPVHSPAAFVLGLFLGTAAELGESVWTSSLCHGVNNLLSVALPAVGLTVASGAPASLVAGGLFGAGVALFAWVARRRARPRGMTAGFSVG